MRIGKLVITRNKSYESKFKFYRSKEEKSSFVWAFLCGPIVFIWIKLGLSDRARNWPCPCGSGKKFKKCCQPHVYSYTAGQMASAQRKTRNKKRRQKVKK